MCASQITILRQFDNGTQDRLNIEPQGVPEVLDGTVRWQSAFSIIWVRRITILLQHYNGTQERLNNDPQGVPEALDRFVRQQI